MSHWSNRNSQQIGTGSGIFTTIIFDRQIVPGSNPVSIGGNFSYSYHVNIIQTSGTFGPIPISAVLAVNGINKTHTRTFADIDTGIRAVLSHTGELSQLQIGDNVTVRIHINGQEDINIPFMRTAKNRCTLTLRKAAGQGT